MGEHKLDEFGIDCEDFCKLANDKVLLQFANGYKFNYSGWIEAREQRKTGYGTSLTTGMLGAVYLPHNSKLFISMLHNALRDYIGKTAPKRCGIAVKYHCGELMVVNFRVLLALWRYTWQLCR